MSEQPVVAPFPGRRSDVRYLRGDLRADFHVRDRAPIRRRLRNEVDDVRFPFLVSDGDEGAVGWAGLASYSTRPCLWGA